MSFSSENPESPTKSTLEKASGFPLFRVFLLMAFGLAVVGTLGYLLMTRLTELSEQLNDVNQQLERAMKELEAVAEKSEAAKSRASQAEENALEAARGRVQAEATQAAAEETAEQAQEEAEKAKQETQLAQEKAHLAQEEARLGREEAKLAREEEGRLRREREEELNRLHTALNQIVETRRTALGVVMNLGNDSMQFDFDKATLRPENRELLSKVVGILLTARDYGIYVYGHTDDIGSEEYNLELSKRRAQAVRDYLVEDGITPGIITTNGFGKSKPVVSGTSAMARAKNRRVEIGIVDTVINYEERVSSQVGEEDMNREENFP